MTEKLHTILFVGFGFGILLTYGLGSISYSLPKWLFLIVAAAAIVCWAAVRLSRAQSLRLYRIDLILLAFCAYAALSLLWSPDPAGGLTQVAGLAAIAALFLYARACDAQKLEFRFSLVCVCAAAIMVLRSLFVPDVDGGFGNENYFAEALLVVLPLLWLWFQSRETPDRWAGAVLIVAVIGVLLFRNGSRIEYAALPALGWTALLVFILRRKGRRGGAVFAAASLIVLAMAAWLFQDRLFALDPVVERLEIYINSARLWLDDPLPGTGLGGFGFGYQKYQQFHLSLIPSFGHIAIANPFGFADAVHNEPLQLLVELGLPGIILIGFLVYQIGAKALRAGTPSALTTAAACASVILAAVALFNFPIQNAPTAALAALVLGILARPGDAERPALTIKLPWVVAVGAAAIGACLLAGTLTATHTMHFAARDFAISQAVRDRAPGVAFEHVLKAYRRFPLSVEYRRQLFVTYVDHVAKTLDRPAALRRDHADYFRIGLTAAPYSPGFQLSRIRFLLLAVPLGDARPEVERILADLKARTPYMSDVHRAEAFYARAIGEPGRARRALDRANELRVRYGS